MHLPIDKVDYTLFWASTTISLGDGAKANFWKDAWLHPKPFREIAPSLYRIAGRKNRTVKDALDCRKWIVDLRRKISEIHVMDFVHLFTELDRVVLMPQIPDNITWPNSQVWSKDLLSVSFRNHKNAKSLHVIQHRLPTSGVLATRHMPNDYWCPLYTNHQETPIHMFTGCTCTKRI